MAAATAATWTHLVPRTSHLAPRTAPCLSRRQARSRIAHGAPEDDDEGLFPPPGPPSPRRRSDEHESAPPHGARRTAHDDVCPTPVPRPTAAVHVLRTSHSQTAILACSPGSGRRRSTTLHCTLHTAHCTLARRPSASASARGSVGGTQRWGAACADRGRPAEPLHRRTAHRRPGTRH